MKQKKVHFHPLSLEHFANAPFSTADRDVLMSAELLACNRVSWPDLTCFPVFDLMPTHQAKHIAGVVTTCVLKAAELQMAIDIAGPDPGDQKLVQAALRFYLLEAQRVAGYLFPPDNIFWDTFFRRFSGLFHDNLLAMPFSQAVARADFDQRVRLRYGLYLLPLDILYAQAASGHTLAYELLSQSLVAVLTGILRGLLNSEAGNDTYFQKAIRLAKRLDLPGFDAWVTSHFTHQN